MKRCSFEIAKFLDEKGINIPSKDIYALEDISYFPPRHDDEHYAKIGDLIRDYDNCEYLELEDTVEKKRYLCSVFNGCFELACFEKANICFN